MTLRARLQRAPLLGFFAPTFAGSFGPRLAAVVVVASTRPAGGLCA